MLIEVDSLETMSDEDLLTLHMFIKMELESRGGVTEVDLEGEAEAFFEEEDGEYDATKCYYCGNHLPNEVAILLGVCEDCEEYEDEGDDEEGYVYA